MKYLSILFLLAYSFIINSMQQPPASSGTFSKKRKLSAEQALNSYHEELGILANASAIRASSTPILDSYKCAFILGCLKPSGQAKLRRKVPHEIGALLAQRKHMGKPLSATEELEVLEWQQQLIQKYLSKENYK
jgi:hypothetical protein